MRTQLPLSQPIDFGHYLDAYMQRPDAIRALPTEEELMELARKGIIREQLVLLPLPTDAPAETGDTAVLETVSSLPKFNKPRVTVTLGRGLYNKELENALIGCKVGNTVSLTIQEQPVRATVLELKRKQAPEPTDAMVEALQAKDMKGQPIHTVAEYQAYIREEKTMEALANINYYVMEKILADYPIPAYDEEDIRVLGELERVAFIKLFEEQEDIDLRQQVPDGWKESGIHSLDEFIAVRHEWYQMKIQQCLVYLNILGLPCEGKTDPLDHYEVLSELQLKIFDLIKTELERRNAR